MKKILKLFTLVLVFVMMTGCVKYKVNMQINADKSMTFEALLAAQISNDPETKQSVDADAMKKLEEKGYKIEEYKEGNYEGFKISKKYDDIDKLSTKEAVSVDLNSFLSGDEPNYFFKKKGNKYIANFKFNMYSTNTSTDDADILPEPEKEDETTEESTDETEVTTIGPSESTEEDGTELTSEGLDLDLSGMDMDYEISFKVSAPVIVSSNATSQDGNELTWDLSTHTDDINFEFQLSKSKPINIILIAALAAVAVVVVVIIIIVLTSKKGNKTTATTQEPKTE